MLAFGNGKAVDPRVDKLVADYIKVRNHIKAVEKRQAAELEEFKVALKKLEGRLLQFLDYHGQEMARTAFGTVSATVRPTASLQDPDIFMEFIVERGLFDLLDRRANATACRDFAKENNGVLPPGVRINFLRGVSVRTATSEKAE